MTSALAEHIHVSSPSTALREVEDSLRHWYCQQPGVLFPYRSWDIAPPTHYGGLAQNQALFVIVPSDLVHTRRQHYLHYLAWCLGMQDPVQQEAYAALALQEVIEDQSPRPHPAFEADALARQVAYWLGLLSCRKAPQTAAWRW